MTLDPTRRTVLSLGTTAMAAVAGCVTAPGGQDGPARSIQITSVDDRPAIPVRPAVSVIADRPTESRPAKLRARVTNESDEAISVGEERAIVFAFVHSVDRPGLVLLPDSTSTAQPVRPGCWRLTDPIAIAEYYGVVDLDPGESFERTLGVWGGPELSDGCLPLGTYRFETAYSGGPSREGGIDPPDWTVSWGFDLRVE